MRPKTLKIDRLSSIRVPPGKSFGFWRNIFIPPRALQEIANNFRAGKEAHVLVDRGEKGPFVKEVFAEPKLVPDETDFQRWVDDLENAPLDSKEVYNAFWGAHYALRGNDDIPEVWLERLRKANEILNQRKADAARKAREQHLATATLDQIKKDIANAIAHVEKNGGEHPAIIRRDMLKRAAAAGVKGAAAELADAEREVAELEKIWDEGAKKEQEIKARMSDPELVARAEEIFRRVFGSYQPDARYGYRGYANDKVLLNGIINDHVRQGKDMVVLATNLKAKIDADIDAPPEKEDPDISWGGPGLPWYDERYNRTR
jgi:hypothetical protein